MTLEIFSKDLLIIYNYTYINKYILLLSSKEPNFYVRVDPTRNMVHTKSWVIIISI